jgi:hypothetical protein
MFLHFVYLAVGINCCVQAKFFVVSDLHYDVFYNQSYNQTSQCHVLSTKGVPGNITENVQPVVRPGCDSSLELIRQTIKTMSFIDPNPDFILVLGDSIGHFTRLCEIINLSESKNCIKNLIFQSYQSIFEIFSQFFPKTQIIPMIGNNDVFVDYQEPRGEEKKEFYTFLYNLWKPFVQDLPSVFLDEGYFNTSTRTGFKIIVMNSNVFYIKENLLIEAQIQFEWLEQQLILNQKIMILMHISPTMGLYESGQLYWHEVYVQHFVELINKYQKNIECIMAGHYHNGIFSLIKQVPIIINPSISPIFNGNPQFRLYDWEMNNYQQFTLDAQYFTGDWQVRSFSQEFGYLVDYERLIKDLDSEIISLTTFLEWVTGWWIYENPNFFSMCLPIYGKHDCLNLNESQLIRIAVCQARYQIPLQFNLCKSGSIERLIKKYS